MPTSAVTTSARPTSVRGSPAEGRMCSRPTRGCSHKCSPKPCRPPRARWNGRQSPSKS
ncbi:MAG: hypothetical protein MZV64_59835 [Ignavibacteriales bacterium]|nr:hypothetical protein [Ignavibacteriales bacterium]